MKRFTRFWTAVALLLGSIGIVNAQPTPQPSPDTSGRGAHATPAAFYAPTELVSPVRGTSYVVTTFADESGDGCNQLGTGLSLREALEECVAVDGFMVVYLPAGEYTLNAAIEPDFLSLVLIGESPTTTIIEAATSDNIGVDNLLRIDAANQAVTIMNLTFRSGNSLTSDDSNGGAIAVDGHGTLTLHNVVFAGNTGYNGGALAIDTDGSPFTVSISNATFTGNFADESGGAIYFHGTESNGNHLRIRDSVMEYNQACDLTCPGNGFGGAVYVLFGGSESDAVTIDDSRFSWNSVGESIDNAPHGGALAIDHQGGDLSLHISNSDFYVNRAGIPNPGELGYGGALYVHSDRGVHTIAHSNFAGNNAGAGGAIFDYSASALFAESSLTIDTVHFSGNYAEISAGALHTLNRSVSIVATIVSENGAGLTGGGLDVSGDPVYISDSMITNNRAGSDTSGTGGSGGGLHLNYGAVLARTLVEDNVAEIGPDCRTYTRPVTSLGGVGITSLRDCSFVPDQLSPAPPTDQVDNLLVNGGFEAAYESSGGVFNDDVPAGWTVKNASGDKRSCYLPSVPPQVFTPYGKCAFVFKAGGGTTLTQNVVIPSGLPNGDELLLFALGDGAKGSKVVIQVTATYADTSLGNTKAKLTFSGRSPSYEPAPGVTASLVLTSGTLSKLQVKITDKSTSGKFLLDRVYLFRAEPLAVLPAPLPLPSAPADFRSSN